MRRREGFVIPTVLLMMFLVYSIFWGLLRSNQGLTKRYVLQRSYYQSQIMEIMVEHEWTILEAQIIAEFESMLLGIIQERNSSLRLNLLDLVMEESPQLKLFKDPSDTDEYTLVYHRIYLSEEYHDPTRDYREIEIGGVLLDNNLIRVDNDSNLEIIFQRYLDIMLENGYQMEERKKIDNFSYYRYLTNNNQQYDFNVGNVSVRFSYGEFSSQYQIDSPSFTRTSGGSFPLISFNIETEIFILSRP